MTINDPATIWRLHLLPKVGVGADDPERVVKFCHARSVLGMGWAVDAEPEENISWSEYEERVRAENLHKNVNNVRRLKEKVKINDLVWTKTPNKEYYLARVIDEWRYEPAPEFVDVNMVNVRKVDEFVFVGNESQVPGKVVRSFRGGHTLQRVNGVDDFSRDLWNKCSPPTSPKYLER